MIRVMQGLSTVGNWQYEAPFVAIVAAVLWRSGHRWRGLRFVIFGAVGEIFYILTKLLMQRPRPTVVSHLSGAGGFSFPSGHAMLAPILWGVGLWLLGDLTGSRAGRIACMTLAVIIALGIAVSRVYLGVHYPTDVVGGLALGLAWSLYWKAEVCDAAERPPR
jgi:undecaprenyl-diphosphatase